MDQYKSAKSSMQITMKKSILALTRIQRVKANKRITTCKKLQ
jgi:hypothetical protein